MNVIEQHIQSDSFSPVYLLFGEESFLVRSYTKKLQNAIAPPGSEMNVSIYKGETFSFSDFTDQALTLPFFAPHRVLVVTESGLFRKDREEMAEFLPSVPDTTVIVFAEKEIDPKSSLFKYIKENGTVLEFKRLKEKELSDWVVRYLANHHKRIQVSAIRLFLERTGDDMQTIRLEADKLISYTGDSDAILLEDVRALTTEHTQTKIFRLSDLLSRKDRAGALAMYHELLSQRYTPLRLLAMLASHFDRLWKIKDLRMQGYDQGKICEKLHMKPYAVKMGVSQAEAFSEKQLQTVLAMSVQTEAAVKTGKMAEELAVEVLIIQICGV